MNTPLSRLWTDSCNIYTFTQREGRLGGSEKTRKLLYQDVPCRFSFSAIEKTTNKDGAPVTRSVIKMFCSSDLEIPAGCVITGVRGMRTLELKMSGEPAVYSAHQEIILERSDFA